MEVKAKLKFLKMGPKKLRLLADVIRGLDVAGAQAQLSFVNKIAAKPLIKLINSAIANAENNFDLKKDNLFIKKIIIDEGPVLRRWQPKAHGRATPIKKRSCHINLILAEKVVTKKAGKKEKGKVAAPILVQDLKSLPKETATAAEEKKSALKEADEKREEIFDARRKGKHRPPQHPDKKKVRKGMGKIKSFFSRKAV